MQTQSKLFCDFREWFSFVALCKPVSGSSKINQKSKQEFTTRSCCEIANLLLSAGIEISKKIPSCTSWHKYILFSKTINPPSNLIENLDIFPAKRSAQNSSLICLKDIYFFPFVDMAVYTAYLRKHFCPRRSISTGFNFDVRDKLLLTPYSGHVSENELNFTRIPVFAPSHHFIVNVLHYCLMFSVCSSRDCQITVPDPKIARGQWSFSLWRKLLLHF